MEMLKVAYSRLADAYFGTAPDDKKKISPAIIAILMQLLQGLLGGCGPTHAHVFMQNNPRRGKARCRLFLWVNGNEVNGYTELDEKQACDALCAVAMLSTAEEAEQFFTEMNSLAA